MDVKFTIDPDAILFDRRLSSTEYRVMLLLINRASRSFMGIEGRFKCLISDMAMMIGLSEHTVKLSIKTLERLNYIKIEKDGLSNVYSIRWDTVEAMDKGECDGTAIVKKTKIETPKVKAKTVAETAAQHNLNVGRQMMQELKDERKKDVKLPSLPIIPPGFKFKENKGFDILPDEPATRQGCSRLSDSINRWEKRRHDKYA